MRGLLDVVAGTALMGIACALLTSALVAAAYPTIRGRLRSRTPVVRGEITFVLAILPAVLGSLIALLTFMPSILAALSLQPDHCGSANHGHPHLCLLHPPGDPLGAGPLLVLACVVVAASVACGRQLLRTRRRQNLVGSLTATASCEEDRDVRWISSSMPFAVALGGRRGVVLVSTVLSRRLAPRELDAVIAHEKAHLERRDGICRTVAHLLSLLHFPWARRQLLADLAAAGEEACDDVAARAVGDRLTVASALLSVARIWAETSRDGAELVPAFAGADVAERIERLLDDSRPLGGQARYFRGLVVGAIVVASIGFNGSIHHLAETVVGTLL